MELRGLQQLGKRSDLPAEMPPLAMPVSLVLSLVLLLVLPLVHHPLLLRLARCSRRCATAVAVLLAACLLAQAPAAAQGVELVSLQTQRDEATLTLDFAVRLNLPRAVEEALKRGVPMYFVAEARLLRNRWYWRDERVARATRSWRVAYQPLTSTWRVSLGALNQTFASLSEALVATSSSANWRLAELSQLEADKSYVIEFSYRLDTSQLPGPMQFGLGGSGEFALGLSRELRVEP